MNQIARIGHNGGPDPLDEAVAPFADAIAEAEAWLDGQEVTNEGQMKAVDAILKDIKAAYSAVDAAEKSETAPIYDAWKAEKARWKPTIDDLDRIKRGLAALVNGFKTRLAAEKEAARRKAEAEAAAARRAAEEAARAAAATDIEAQRAAEDAMRAAAAATKAAQDARKDTVKGLRTVTRYEVTDYRALLHWVAKNDRAAVTDFIDEWARKNHKTASAAGLRVWQEKEAF